MFLFIENKAYDSVIIFDWHARTNVYVIPARFFTKYGGMTSKSTCKKINTVRCRQ